MEDRCPRVLILNGYAFNDFEGGGITLKNLFLGWPLDKIAVAHGDSSKPMSNICTNYYRFGYDDNYYIFPLNYISNEPREGISGPYTPEDVAVSKPISSETVSEINTKPSPLKRIFLSVISNSGLYEYVHPLRLTDQFKEWVLKFNPDIIYSQCGSLTYNTMLDKVQKLTGAKVVTHTMDDWPSAIYKDKFLSPFLRYMVNRKFTHNLRKASLRLGISEAMAEEFEKRYKLPFSYFHNPVNCDEFNNVEYKKIAGQHTIVYAGRIGIASNDAIAEFSQCVAELRKEGHNIIFKIYTNLQSEGLDRSKFNFDGTDLCASLKDDNHVQRISEADLLLYPVDFSDESIQYIRLSFPTKLPSYFSSGVPVFCYGPENVYSIKFVSKKNLGFVCAQHTIADLKKVLLSALNDPNLKSKYAETARKYAFDNFDKTIVRERFHNELKKVYLNARTE